MTKALKAWNSRWLERRARKHHFSVPILCYHSWTMYGTSYENNDHVALESDLATLAEKGYQVLPLTELVAVLRGAFPKNKILGKKFVCLTCDDGMDYDYHNYFSEEFGDIPSFHSILQKSEDVLPQPVKGPRAVSFVIASPKARDILDQRCGHGREMWNDAWWKECAAKGILGIANHSWDHVHELLDEVRQHQNSKGSFFEIANFDDAQAQIADAQSYIDSRTDRKALPFFCYPYGHVSEYLRDEYFPSHGHHLGIHAAFSTAGKPVNGNSCIWDIPRFVCGFHWKSPDQFNDLLDAVAAGER